jgi:hypothetical protein
MSNQVEPGAVGSAAAAPAPADLAEQAGYVPQDPRIPVVYPEPFHGRAVSWVAVSIIMVAFVIGGLALVFGPTWWLFYASLGLAVVGGLIALATNIFDDWY